MTATMTNTDALNIARAFLRNALTIKVDGFDVDECDEIVTWSGTFRDFNGVCGTWTFSEHYTDGFEAAY